MSKFDSTSLRFPARSRRADRVSGSASDSKGFTLLEVLLALALLGSLLVALNVFVFSMAEAWGRGRDERLFAQHARAVTNHVEDLLEAASLGAVGDAPTVKEIRQENGGDAPKLTFTLPEGSRLLTWPEAPLPDVELSLSVDEGKGLIIGWQSRLEIRRDREAPRATVISPFVTSIGWEYYDASFKRWELLDEPKRENAGTYLVPQRMRLRFSHGKMNLERVLIVPVRGEGATRS
jgi:prepilin-type N-terminal cleavage/methylation domain-containing protein